MGCQSPKYFIIHTRMRSTIIIPTYNEFENIQVIIPRIFDIVPDTSVLVVDDNSPDGTKEAVNDLKRKYPNLSLLSRSRKEGLGKAYTDAFKEVLKDVPDIIIMMDADLSHDPKYLLEMMRQARLFDLVIGSRYVQGGATVGWELWRKALSFFGNLYARLVTNLPAYDLTAGFNCINVAYLQKVNLESIDSSGYAFQIELKYLLRKAGAKLVEIPITFVNRTGGESKISNHIISEGIMAPWKILWKTITKK